MENENQRFCCIDPEREPSPSMAGLMLNEAIRNLESKEGSLSEEGLSILVELRELENSEIEVKNSVGEDISERSMADLRFLKKNAEKIRELHKKARKLINTDKL